MLLSTDLQQEHPRLQKYRSSESYFDTTGSFLFLGFEIKSKYDEDRLQIHKSLEPKFIRHAVKSADFYKDRYFYGITIEGNKLHNQLVSHLVKCSVMPKYNLNIESYIILMQEHNISTKNSYGYYDIGLYPLDNLQDVCDDNIDYSLFFINKRVEFYQSIASVKPFIFCKID